MIPMVVRLVAKEYDESSGRYRGVGLWIPLLPIWVLALPLLLLIFTAWMLTQFIAWMTNSSGAMRAAEIIKAGARVLWKLDGLRVDVRDRKSRFVLHF